MPLTYVELQNYEYGKDYDALGIVKEIIAAGFEGDIYLAMDGKHHETLSLRDAIDNGDVTSRRNSWAIHYYGFGWSHNAARPLSSSRATSERHISMTEY